MRVLVFDYSGHPFQVQLSRALAARGHSVLHVFSSAFQTPKGSLARRAGDPDTFDTRALTTAAPFAKGSFVRRRAQEIEIGHAFAAVIAEWRPDAIISSNAPLDVQRIALRAARRQRSRFIFWLQDVYSRAMQTILPQRFPVIGNVVAAGYAALEYSMLRRSDAVVAITADFVPLLVRHGVARERIAVIENWAPLDEIPPAPRDNPTAQALFADDATRIVYSGTIGYKHDPGLLLALARHLPDAHVHVFSEGAIVDELAARARDDGIANFSVHPWVSFADLPQMLAGADILVALIEAEAGIYSVPSKILTYLAAGRPILASVPAANLAARTVLDVGAGRVAEPGDQAGFLAAAAALAGDPAARARAGAAGRAHAERAFDIDAIAQRFERLLIDDDASGKGISG